MSVQPESSWEQQITRETSARLPPSNGGQASAAEDELPHSVRSSRTVADEEIEDRKHSRDMRGAYANKAYSLALYALIGWATFLLLAGASNVCHGLPMYSDRVVIAVTTGITVSVLTAFVGVIRGLFGHGKDRK